MGVTELRTLLDYKMVNFPYFLNHISLDIVSYNLEATNITEFEIKLMGQ